MRLFATQHLFRCVFLFVCLFLPAQGAELRVHYDTGWGNSISVRGDGGGLSWYAGSSATWTSGNVWVYTTPNSGGGFEFKPLLNDIYWSVGANYPVPSSTSVVDVYPFFGQANGSLQVIQNFSSQILGNSRSIRIYLPPSYFENTLKSYPVIYMHDGQNLFESSTSAFGVEWEVDETVDALVAQGRMGEAVIVGVDNAGANRINEYTMTPDPTYGGGGGAQYLDFMEQELMPWIETNYRVRTGAENTTIMGSSLGGLISFCASWNRPDVFGTAVCMSSSFWWDGDGIVSGVETYTGPFVDARFYIDIGAGESMVSQTNRMRDALEDLGYQHNDNLWHYYDQTGSHNEASWRDRLHIPLERVMPWQ